MSEAKKAASEILAGMSPEMKEVLDPYIKDCLVILLENRPENPTQFLVDYFRHAVKGTKPLIRSYRYIRLTKHNRETFMTNLMSAFRTMDAKRGIEASSKNSSQNVQVPGVTKEAYIQLLKLLCDDFPLDVINGIMTILNKTDDDVIDFRDFCGGVFACFVYEEFFEQIEWLFKATDPTGQGTVSGDALMQIIETMRRQANPSVTIPPDKDLRRCLRMAGIVDLDPSHPNDAKLGFKQFALALFRVCIPAKFSSFARVKGDKDPAATQVGELIGERELKRLVNIFRQEKSKKSST
mmetsp:Transcript_489/g.813  ORF Transcript_489/g.813 Transcript_489/m.813 type:complete len:295 (+) Transcript_489:77-961(+)|eukprot:CAMPEP_0197528310 /NCGR_PEP_ID=MMETSP1318-20131121/24641_1 /TAXON_ID=552666 /ORGANISM="Partenskyella glossopodia, Strain RCC365" /LENGTH=294 /DNA_ID=CAMNT_0043083355 /DNA_START=67 /DNA_END=951 /DNA_ORIENTATION=+